MSAKGRKSKEPKEKKENKQELYETPKWLVYAFWKKFADQDLLVNSYKFMEPCCASGNVIKATNKFFKENHLPDINWSVAEINPKFEPELHNGYNFPSISSVFIGDYLTAAWPKTKEDRFDLIITNPPFSLAEKFIEKAITEAKVVVMLLRVNFLGSKKRVEFFKKYKPDIYISPKRPSFEKGGTDATEYAWFVWNSDNLDNKVTRYYMLDFPTKEELKEWNK